ncbi:MAG: hypothetical protein HGA25_02895 [Clostridiales bacterium]|nr:hypothetical protein [Clostridiales bacterium]
MTKIIKIIGIMGFIICLMVMYLTDHGISGIQTYDCSFRLLDMRFHYTSKIVNQTFEQISAGGRIAYQKYLVLDFIFIICFLVVMISISSTVFTSPHVKLFLYTLCGLRALLDVLENILLLRMLRQYPDFDKTLASICSWSTTFKFIMLYIWLLLMILSIILMTFQPSRQ